jgi:ATP-binding cassette, subfamily B, bacterial
MASKPVVSCARDSSDRKAHKHTFVSLLRYVTPSRGTLCLALALMLGESALMLASPWLAGQLTGALLTDADAGAAFNRLILLWLVLLALQGLFGFSSQFVLGVTGERMIARLRMRLYDHLQALPVGYYHERKKGDVLALLTNDAYLLSGFVTETLTGLLPLLLTFFGAFLFMWRIEPVIASLAGLFVPLVFVVMKLLGRGIRPLARELTRQYADTLSIVEENLALLPIIKSFTREALESDRFQRGNLHLLELTARYLRIQSLISPVVRFLAGAGILLLLWISSRELVAGGLSMADLVALLLYGMLLTQPMSRLANVYASVQHARGAAERLLEVFSVEPEPMDEGGQPLPPVRGEIEFRKIHFCYPGREELFHGLTLHIQAGETIAITGENGAGKSTLVHLLMRFAEPEQGLIFIDGIDIRTVTLNSLRRQIGMVQQQLLLLNGTVRENIAFGYPAASREAIESAARAAHASDFIQRLPQGFDTLIGDQGVKLSGGQKQRLSLARALLKDPPILVLDEATAMFDPGGEQMFIHECRDILRQRTVILITHRPASLALADRIVRMEEGRVMEIGG